VSTERSNVEGSLEAAEQALAHLSRSLEEAGFATGVGPYRQMSDIILGQWLWVEANGVDELEPRFGRIAGLAGSIASYLTPYVDVMKRLTALRGLLWERWGILPDSTSARVLTALLEADRPMTIDELRSVTRVTRADVRREIHDLVERELVRKTGGRSSRYAIVGAVGDRARSGGDHVPGRDARAEREGRQRA
jgi:hypothetical protein